MPNSNSLLTIPCRWKAAQLTDFNFLLWLLHGSPTSPGPLANSQGYLFPFVQKILWVIRKEYGSRLMVRGEFCPLIIELFVEDGSVLHVIQSTIYNVQSSTLIVLRLPKQIKVAGEIISLEEASQLAYKLLMKLDQTEH